MRSRQGPRFIRRPPPNAHRNARYRLAAIVELTPCEVVAQGENRQFPRLPPQIPALPLNYRRKSAANNIRLSKIDKPGNSQSEGTFERPDPRVSFARSLCGAGDESSVLTSLPERYSAFESAIADNYISCRVSTRLKSRGFVKLANATICKRTDEVNQWLRYLAVFTMRNYELYFMLTI